MLELHVKDILPWSWRRHYCIISLLFRPRPPTCWFGHKMKCCAFSLIFIPLTECCAYGLVAGSWMFGILAGQHWLPLVLTWRLAMFSLLVASGRRARLNVSSVKIGFHPKTLTSFTYILTGYAGDFTHTTFLSTVKFEWIFIFFSFSSTSNIFSHVQDDGIDL